MIRNIGLSLVVALSLLSHAAGQEWARKMFTTHSHDFGAVARGAKTEFEFVFENPYEETLHVASVRASCGCTKARVTNDTIKSWEKAAIVATVNTQAYLGHRTATITVTFDRPFVAEVQLTVAAHIRSDVVLSPGEVDFGATGQGQEAERKISISYAGRQDWKILDVRSACPYVEVDLQETQRGGGRVGYDMTVYLKPDAPSGYLQEQLVLITDDPRLSQVPVTVQGRIAAPLTVSPSSLFMGVVVPGQAVTKQLVVRGKQPFRIKEIRCSDSRFSFKAGDQEKALHTVPVTFTAGDQTGKVADTIEIETDFGGTLVVSCQATATIVDPQTRSSSR